MKLKSRKFWISVAAVLASIGASIAGLATNEKWVTVVGIICTMASSAIYAGCEAYVDGARLGNVEDIAMQNAIDQARSDSNDNVLLDEENGDDLK